MVIEYIEYRLYVFIEINSRIACFGVIFKRLSTVNGCNIFYENYKYMPCSLFTLQNNIPSTLL